MKRNRLLAAALAVCMLLGVTSCGSPKEVGEQVSTALQAGGREYGKTYTAEEGEALQSSFFTYQVNSAEIVTELGEYVPQEADQVFLKVNITIKNTFQDDASIPMFYDDFTLSWPELDGSTIFPESKFIDSQLPDEYTIYKNDSKTGDVVFVVPAGKTEFELVYVEYYEDDFVGNTYRIPFQVEAAA